MNMQRNRSQYFSIDLETGDAGLLAAILKDRALACLEDGRADVQRRLAGYGEQIAAYALDGAELFDPIDFAELCIALTGASRWQVDHRVRQWDKRGDVIVTLGFPDGGEQCWASTAWRLLPDAPQINQLRQGLRLLAPASARETAA